MKKFDANDIDDALKKVPGLTSSKRAYVKGMLMGKNQYGGVSEHELHRAIRDLKHNPTDNISRFQSRKIHENIRGLVEGEDEMDEAA